MDITIHEWDAMKFFAALGSLLFSTHLVAIAQDGPSPSPGFCQENLCKALLIGNDEYRGENGTTFTTSIPAAQNVQRALKQIGFETELLLNATQEDILQATERFKSSNDVEVSLFFYAGNGGSYGDQPIIFPVDFTAAETWEGARSLSIPYISLISQHPGNRLHINVFDTGTAALDPPQFENSKANKGLEAGLKPSVAPYPPVWQNMRLEQPNVETINLYSAQPDSTAYDETLFADILADAIVEPGDAIRNFAKVPDRMAIATALGQLPLIDVRSISSQKTCLVSCVESAPILSRSLAEIREDLEQGVCEGDLVTSSPKKGRLALLIGNNGYQYRDAWGRLTEPTNDANTLADALTETGFRVRKCYNLPLTRMRDEMRTFQEAFEREVQNSDDDTPPAAFFYFSGHGAADANGSYMIPTDSEADAADELRDDAISIDQFGSRFVDEGGQIMVVIDACRNALKDSTDKSDFKGLREFKAWPNMIIASATQPGSLAGQYSGYARLLAQEITKKNTPFWETEVDLVFRDVGEAVERETSGEQRPVVEGRFSGRFYFQPEG